MRLDDFNPKDMYQVSYSTRSCDDHVALDAKLFLPSRKRCRRENRVVSIRSDLVLLEFRGERPLPCLSILAIEQDHSCDNSLVPDLLLNVSAALSLLYPRNSIIAEDITKHLEKINFGVIAEFVGSLVC